jgi:hypothetical protein
MSVRTARLAILPNATHTVPFDDPATFNAIVERFQRMPFVKKDRIGDAMSRSKRCGLRRRQ